MLITFTLEQQDAAALINLIGQLPTSAGVFPLHQMFIQQFNNQVNTPKDEAAPVVESEVAT